VAALALVPAAAHRDPLVMLPWEVLLLAALPIIGRSFATVPLTSQFATYLSVAALALIIAVELHLFTPVLMTPSFAVLFVVVATMATAGVWAVVRWSLDLALGTAFLLDPTLTEAEIETRLMWEFVYSTVAGLVAGLIFEGYFRRRARLDSRLPEGVEVRGP
jgi:glucan phosphoethanolaminetransferase (alkaline phosphatase superfamily)